MLTNGSKQVRKDDRGIKASPCRQRSEPERLFGADRDIIDIRGDIVDSPSVQWEAAVDPDRVVNCTKSR